MLYFGEVNRAWRPSGPAVAHSTVTLNIWNQPWYKPRSNASWRQCQKPYRVVIQNVGTGIDCCHRDQRTLGLAFYLHYVLTMKTFRSMAASQFTQADEHLNSHSVPERPYLMYHYSHS